MWRELVQEFHGKSLGSPLYVAGACSGIPREISRITSICGGSLFRNSTANMVEYLGSLLFVEKLVQEFHCKYAGISRITSICGKACSGVPR